MVRKNDRILSAWFGAAASPERIQRVGDAKEVMYRDLARREGVVALPGAVEWVRHLRRDEWLQAIASSAPRANMDVVLRVVGIADQIDATVSAEDVTAGKPDPQVFLAAATRLGVPPDRCIVVEDAAAGIEAAKRAGMRSIGVNASTVLDADVYVTRLANLPSNAFKRLLSTSA